MLNNKIKGISSLIGSILTHLLIGNIFGFGNFIPYLISYLHYKGKEIKELDLYFIPAIGIALHNMLPSLTGYLDIILGTRILLLIGIILISISQFLIFQFTTEYYILVISYILFGIANSLTYFQTMKNCWKYFPNKKGIITGLILSSFGLSVFIFTSIGDYIINPNGSSTIDNGYYSEEISNNFLIYIKFYLFSIIIIGFISVILVFPYENEIKIEEFINNENNDNNNIDYTILPKDSSDNSRIDNDNIENNISNNELNINNKEEYPSLNECLCSKEFLICILTVGCTLLFGFLLSNTYRTFGKIMKIKEKYLQTLSKCYTLINTFSRIIWGIILDKFNFTIPYFILCVNQIICSGFFYWSVFKVETYYLVCCFGVLSFAGHVTLFPNVINKKFGIENSVTLLGICGLFSGITCLLGPILTKSIIVSNDDYMIIYLIGSFTSLISSILTWFIKYEKVDFKKV